MLGVVSVGSCANQIELHELCRLHEAVKNKFVSTLFDSRCVVLCEGKENGVEERANNIVYIVINIPFFNIIFYYLLNSLRSSQRKINFSWLKVPSCRKKLKKTA